jgi:hypothetical protein
MRYSDFPKAIGVIIGLRKINRNIGLEKLSDFKYRTSFLNQRKEGEWLECLSTGPSIKQTWGEHHLLARTFFMRITLKYNHNSTSLVHLWLNIRLCTRKYAGMYTSILFCEAGDSEGLKNPHLRGT